MERVFRPQRQRGIILHLGALLLNLSAVGFLVLTALSQSVRGFFILYLVAGSLLFLPLPVMAYRFFALLRAKYTISREGLGIQWGLRGEDIPLQRVEWVRLASDLAYRLSLPRFSVAGAVLGSRTHRDLGPVEFIASSPASLVLIATHEKVYAISPLDPHDYMQTFNRYVEMGSIEPFKAKTSHADFLIGSLLADKAARSLILAGIALSIGLLVAVSFIIPARETIPFGFNPLGQVMESSPSDRLLLLPLLSLLLLAVDLGFGSYLYRKETYRTAAYFVFASAFIMPLSFLGVIAVLLI